jgi:hypothetical protein
MRRETLCSHHGGETTLNTGLGGTTTLELSLLCLLDYFAFLASCGESGSEHTLSVLE